MTFRIPNKSAWSDNMRALSTVQPKRVATNGVAKLIGRSPFAQLTTRTSNMCALMPAAIPLKRSYDVSQVSYDRKCWTHL